MDMDNFLDLWDIWVNELVGDVWLFVFLGIVVIVYIAVKNKLSFEVATLLTILFLSIIFARATGLLVLWVFILLCGGALFYYYYQKIIKEG